VAGNRLLILGAGILVLRIKESVALLFCRFRCGLLFWWFWILEWDMLDFAVFEDKLFERNGNY